MKTVLKSAAIAAALFASQAGQAESNHPDRIRLEFEARKGGSLLRSSSDCRNHAILPKSDDVL